MPFLFLVFFFIFIVLYSFIGVALLVRFLWSFSNSSGQ